MTSTDQQQEKMIQELHPKKEDQKTKQFFRLKSLALSELYQEERSFFLQKKMAEYQLVRQIITQKERQSLQQKTLNYPTMSIKQLEELQKEIKEDKNPQEKGNAKLIQQYLTQKRQESLQNLSLWWAFMLTIVAISSALITTMYFLCQIWALDSVEWLKILATAVLAFLFVFLFIVLVLSLIYRWPQLKDSNKKKPGQ